MDSFVTGVEPGTAAPASGTSQALAKRLSAKVPSDAAGKLAAIKEAKATQRARVAASDGVAA